VERALENVGIGWGGRRGNHPRNVAGAWA
jgi:hypothetical protein